MTKLTTQKIKGFAITMLASACLFLSFGSVSAQNTAPTTVKGSVTDKRGDAIAGVTVTVKDGKAATLTNASGEFTIEVPANGVLRFTLLGMKPMDFPVSNRTFIAATMEEDAIDISDVVVIGYGTQSRATLTTSISKIGSNDLAAAPSGSPLVMMQGKIPGVDIRVTSGQPGAAPTIIIRGGTTTNPDNDTPLFIVDGVIRPNMRDINHNDIASIEVLKDAASTAIYGSRASNGIVIITTKSGKAGEGVINFRYGLSIETQAKRHPLSDAREYLTATRTAALHSRNPNSYLVSGTFGMTTSNPRNSIITTAYLDDYIRNYGQAYTEDLLLNQGWETMLDPVDPKRYLIFKDTDFQDVLFQTAVNHEYNLSMSGGNEKATYYMSAGYLDQDGIVLGTYYNRWNVLLNSSYKIKKNLTASGIFDYSQRKTNGVGNESNVMARAAKMPPTMRLFYEDGTPAPGEFRNDFRSRLHEVYYQEKYNQVGRLNLRTELDWAIIDDLHWTNSMAFFNNEGIDHSFERANEIYGDRRASHNHNNDRQWMFESVFNYRKTFAAKHNFDATAGVSYIYENSYWVSGSGDNGASDYIETLNGTAIENQKVSSTYSERRTASSFGRLTYNYDMRYLFSASFRVDGSSNFPVNNRYSFFPGVSGGWNVHREEFFTNVRPYVNNLKLRVSWGQNGYDNLSYGNSHGVYAAGYNYLGEAGITNTTLANRDLVWESTSSLDLGLDLGLLNNRITLMVDLYRKLTFNRLIDQKLPAEFGFDAIKANYGSLLTKGIDFQINATPVMVKDFSWDVSFNFSFLRTIVHKLPDNGAERNRINGAVVYDQKLGKYIEVGGLAEGERPYAVYGYQFDGVYATDADAALAPFDTLVSSYWLTHVNHSQQKYGGDAIWRDLNGDNIIDEKDAVFIGYKTPDKLGAFSTNLNYKNLTLRFVTDFAMGHMIGNNFRAQANANARNNYASLHDVASSEIWKKQGDIASIPRYDVESDWDNGKRNHVRPTPTNIGAGGMGSTLYVGKGDYLAFREVSLSYRHSDKHLQKIGVKALDLSAALYNLGYWTAYDGLSPEVYGDDSGKYPRPRSFIFSVGLTF